MFHQDGCRTVSFIRRAAGEHLEQETAERIDVGAHVKGLSLALLGAHVEGCAQCAAGARQLTELHGGVDAHGAQTEVRDFHLRLAVRRLDHENIVGFEVAVNDTALFSGQHARADLHGQRSCFANRERTLLQECVQIAALYVLHGQEEGFIIDGADAKHLHDVGMFEALQRFGFALQPSHRLSSVGQSRIDEFDGDVAFQLNVGGQPNCAVPAFTKEVFQPVTLLEDGAGSGCCFHVFLNFPAATFRASFFTFFPDCGRLKFVHYRGVRRPCTWIPQCPNDFWCLQCTAGKLRERNVYKRLYIAVMAIASAASAAPAPAGAQSQQSNNEMQMGQLINVLDSQSGWQQTPVSGVMQNNPAMNVSSGLAMGDNGGVGSTMPSGMMVPANGGGMRPVMTNGRFMPSGLMGMQAQPQQTPVNNSPFGMRNLLKAFLGETPGAGSNNANDAAALGYARSQCQAAKDQACQAEGDEGRTKYGDKGARQSAAYSAQCHADAARAAADRATGLAYGKSSAVNDAAAQARAAAVRAQAAADRARYNAATYVPPL